MSPNTILVIAVILVILGLINGVVEGKTRRYIARREYDLLNRELDRNPQVRLKDIRSFPSDDDHQDDQ